ARPPRSGSLSDDPYDLGQLRPQQVVATPYGVEHADLLSPQQGPDRSLATHLAEVVGDLLFGGRISDPGEGIAASQGDRNSRPFSRPRCPGENDKVGSGQAVLDAPGELIVAESVDSSPLAVGPGGPAWLGEGGDIPGAVRRGQERDESVG